MALSNLMFQRADWYRPASTKDTSNATTLGTATVQGRSLPVNIQPASAEEKVSYFNRSMEISHTVFTTRTSYGFQRNDYLTYNSRRFKIVGIRNPVELDCYLALDCLEYKGADLRD